MSDVQVRRGSARLLVVAALAIGALPTADRPVAAQPPPAPRFDVTSLKERDRDTPVGLVGMQSSPGRLVNGCATLTSLAYYAFRRTGSTPIEGLPGWASTPCSDTDTANTYVFQATMSPGTADADVRLMLQAFLIERFKLTFHWETRTLPVFALVVGSGGFKLKASDPKDDPPRAPGSIGCPQDDRRCHMIIMGSAPMRQFVSALGSNLGRPVIDRTGLLETYYLDLKWAGDTSADSSLPSLPAALKEQFGLELRSESGPVEILVIDGAEKPAAN